MRRRNLPPSEQLRNLRAALAPGDDEGDGMMVGGTILEVQNERQPETGRDVVRLWCLDARNGYRDECAVWTEPADDLPIVGDEIWWQGDKIMWTSPQRGFKDRVIPKIGYSFDPIR